MADNSRNFTLVGQFKDDITPALKKLNTQLATTTKSFEKMQKLVRPIAKDMAIMGDAASRMTQGMGGQRNAFETNLRAMKDYRSELGKISSAQRQMERKFKTPAAPFSPASLPRGGGGGGRPSAPSPARSYAPDMGEGFTIEKGVLTGLAVEAMTRIFDTITGAVGKSINYVKGAIQERINDEMGDIQSAGGILSIGKEKKVPWADTYEEAFAIQKRLNGEMANLAAALPGETGDYVANMKQVTDTVMKVTTSNGPAMIKAMQGFNSQVKTNQDAYVEATKQLAKFTTLGSLGQSGGVPLTQLAEEMLNKDKVNVKSLKTTYAALQKNPLVSGALEKYEKEMNKAGAGSAERYTAIIKAFEQAFPAEVLDAMTNSADGIIQGLKSAIYNPDTGLLGLGRSMMVSFKGLNRGMGPLMEEMSVFDMFLKMFKAFGMVLGPIVSELPKMIEPFQTLMDPLKKFYIRAENTISNFKGATKEFGNMKLSFPAFRGSLMAIGKLAKAMGANEKEYATLEKMLYSSDLDLGAVLQQAIKTLFSSKALEDFGRAAGQALGGFLKMMADLLKGGSGLVNQSGIIKGFMDGWNSQGGSQAISTIVRETIWFIIKAILGLGKEILLTDPIGAGVLATIFIGPVRSMVLDFFKSLLSSTRLGFGQAGKAAEAAAQAGGAGLKSGAQNGALGLFRNRRMEARMRLATRKAKGAAGSGAEALGRGYNMAGRPGAGLARGAASAAKGIGRAVPGGALIGGALSVADAVANGKSWGQAAAGGIGAVIGGTLGSALGPAGTLLGSTAGQMIGDYIGGKLSETNSSARAAAEAQKKAAEAMNNATTQAQQKYLTEEGKAGLGGIESINQKFGGGAGLKAMLGNEKWTQQQGMTTEQVASYKQLADQMTGLNSASKAVQDAQNRLAQATSLNTKDKEAAAAALKAATDKQIAAESAALKSWESMQSGTQTKILSAAGVLAQGIEQAANMIRNAAGSAGGVGSGDRNKPGSTPGGVKTDSSNKARDTRRGYDGDISKKMSLGSAISSEMRNKPAGSDLVIANSSETIIPAASGNRGTGIDEMMGILSSGFNNVTSHFRTLTDGVNTNQTEMKQGFKSSEEKNSQRYGEIGSRITKMQADTSSQITSLAAQVKQMGAMGMMGGMGGGGMGGAPGAGAGGGTGAGYGSKGGAIAGQLGTYIKQTGGAPGSIHEHPQHGGVKGRHSPNSYHYQGRAIDIGAYAYEQGGVISRIQQFNAKMGVKPVEFLHAGNEPRGHKDHVHVAYAFGAGKPAFFNSASAADDWESKMASKSPIVSSVRARANEMQNSGPITINAPITINQTAGQDPEELATIVAMKIGEAVQEARSSSIFS